MPTVPHVSARAANEHAYGVMCLMRHMMQKLKIKQQPNCPECMYPMCGLKAITQQWSER